MLALYAPAIFFDGLLQKSVLDVFFVCLALWLIARKQPRRPQRTPRKRNECSLRSRALRGSCLLALGATMGALALTRENALVFIVVILAWTSVTRTLERRTPTRVAARASVPGRARADPRAGRGAQRYVGGGFYHHDVAVRPELLHRQQPAADGTYQSLRFGRGAPEYERQDATELAERALGTSADAGAKCRATGPTRRWTSSRRARARGSTLMARKVALLWNATEMVDTESQEAHAEWSLPLRARRVRRTFRRPGSAGAARRRRHLADALAALDPLRHDAGLRRQRRRVLCVRALSLSARAAADRSSRPPASSALPDAAPHAPRRGQSLDARRSSPRPRCSATGRCSRRR